MQAADCEPFDGESFNFQTEDGNGIELVINSPSWCNQAGSAETLNLDLIFKAAATALQQAPAQAFGASQPPLNDPAIKRYVVIAFDEDEAVQALNNAYRGKDRPTNVLSFPSLEEADEADGIFLGDAILAYKTVIDEAIRDKKPLNDHICHLVIHAVLHLLGYDHETESEAEVMEKLESTLMTALGYKDPYAAIT